jgi:hypothetical protein
LAGAVWPKPKFCLGPSQAGLTCGLVATASCMFVAVLAYEALASEVERRAARLGRFYSLDPLVLTTPAPRVVVGELGGATELDPGAGTLVWGEPLPAGLDVIGADDTQLRSVCGVTAAVAWRAGRLRLVNNSAGPATLYVAEGDGVTAYATHAVAAAVIAGLVVRIDEAAVAEFIALDFSGGTRTLVQGVRVVPPAADIGIDVARTYWRASERWSHIVEPHDYTERVLLETLGERVAGAKVGLALTAGLDSTVGAAALAEIGVRPLAFTWGSPEWPDAQGAAATAARHGFEHEVLGVRTLADDDCLRALGRDARWTDGVTALSAAERHWPDSCEAFAVGMGGETGRAFYYDAWSALLVPRPSADDLARRLGARGRLRGASEEAIAGVEAAVLGWVEEAMAIGARGWNVLDVLYTEQRVRRWGRSQIPQLAQNLVLLFTPAEIARGLASLPQSERLRDGFHRTFLAKRGIARAAPEVPDPGRASLALRRLRHRFRPRSPGAAPGADDVDLLVAQVWSQRPATRDWVREEALRHPLITDTLGAEWAAATAQGFSEARARTTERAMRAAGVVAFAQALEELNSTTN